MLGSLKAPLGVVGILVAAAVTACGDDVTSRSDAGVDGAPPDAARDSGTHDARPDRALPDAALPDPCRADEAHVDDTRGCNGPKPGPGFPDESYGGRCELYAESACGVCVVDRDRALDGICSQECDPGDDFVATAGCPAGSRCFGISSSGGFCLPDCETGADCASGQCFSFGGCAPTSMVCAAGTPALPIDLPPTTTDYKCRTGTSVFGTGNGQALLDACGREEVVIGYEGLLAADGRVGGLRTVCGRLSFEGTGAMAIPHTMRSTTRPLSDYRGQSGVLGTEWARTCPDGQVVVAGGGRAGLLLNELVVHCAPVELRVGSGGYRLARGSDTALPPVGLASGGVSPDSACATGTLAVGTVVRATRVLIGFGLICGDVALVPPV